jgi:hypothetical protein
MPARARPICTGQNLRLDLGPPSGRGSQVYYYVPDHVLGSYSRVVLVLVLDKKKARAIFPPLVICGGERHARSFLSNKEQMTIRIINSVASQRGQDQWMCQMMLIRVNI